MKLSSSFGFLFRLLEVEVPLGFGGLKSLKGLTDNTRRSDARQYLRVTIFILAKQQGT